MLVKKGWGATYEREALSLANNSFEVLVIEAVSAAGSILTERMGLE